VEAALGVYRPRHPEKTPSYRCLEDYREESRRGYEVWFESVYGPLRPALNRAVELLLKCGVLQYGFARLKCQGCGRNRFLAYSCRTRRFCPSCAAKGVASIFPAKALQMLVDEHCLGPEFAARLLSWRHSGFQVYRAESVEPDDRPALERLCA
jgi:hypothetical protein